MSYLARQNVPGSQLTTLEVGGVCARVVDTDSEADLLVALADYPDAICIGGGSNLLIADEGYAGTIIRAFSSQSGIAINDGVVDVAATTSWDVLVAALVEHDLQGLECTSGVPGSVGGAIVQNAGAYGQEIGAVVDTVRAWDRKEKVLQQFDNADCEFEYRQSRFKKDGQRRYVITGAHLRLNHNSVGQPRYGDLQELLAQRHGSEGPYGLHDIRNAVIDLRTTKGMVLGASDPSAGSFFTNPVIDETERRKVRGAGLPVFHRADGTTQTSAAALIEAAGFQRGHRHGNVGLSGKHVLALVNLGGASCAEVITLAKEIRAKVESRFGIQLHPEPVLLGFPDNPFA